MKKTIAIVLALVSLVVVTEAAAGPRAGFLPKRTVPIDVVHKLGRDRLIGPCPVRGLLVSKHRCPDGTFAAVCPLVPSRGGSLRWLQNLHRELPAW